MNQASQARAKTVMFYLVNRSNKELTCFLPFQPLQGNRPQRENGSACFKELVEEGFVEKRSRIGKMGAEFEFV